MAALPDRLMGELKALCRGRGAQAPGMDRQIGPALREACGISESDGSEVAREKLGEWVRALARHFPEDLRLAVVVSLALHAETRHAFLVHRLEWLAHREGRNTRTIRRRVDDGLTRLVEAATSRVPVAGRGNPDGWHVRRLQVVLRLDSVVPTRIERCCVVAEEDGVREVSWVVEPGVDVDVVHGAVVRGGKWSARRRFELPRPLRSGDPHEFAFEVPMPWLSAEDSYLVRPPSPCDRLELVVRFHPDRLPSEVERAYRWVGTAAGTGPEMSINGVGEAEAAFANVLPEHEYGLRRQPSPLLPHLVPGPRLVQAVESRPEPVARRRLG